MAINYLDLISPRYACLDKYPHPEKPQSIKVVTYNIQFSWRISKAIKTLSSSKLKDADILCLQEMTPQAVEKISQALKYNFIYYPALLHPRIKKDFGNAVLSKWPIFDDAKIIFAPQYCGKWQRIAVRATISIAKKKIYVYSTHLKVFLRPHNRCQPIKTIIKSIPPTINYAIIAGDFNSFTKMDQQMIQKAFNEEGFSPTAKTSDWSYNFWYFFNKKTLLDHIFVRGFNKLSSGIVINPSASDHLPLWAELEF